MIVPESFHSASDALPWADNWAGDPGIKLKLLMADIEGGRYAVRMLFAPGLKVAPHKHSGEIHAFTFAGEWAYLEYPGSPSNRAGSYLFEPPGSTHTLKVADDVEGLTDVLFIMYGAMLHLGDGGEILGVTDAESVLREYPELLRQQGKKLPEVLPVGGSMTYRRFA
ncbi:2,4'-dihydroxyacetophenone dioxygenase family protein [Tsuneonella sp. HG222]